MMAQKVSVYVDEKLHRSLKSAALQQGKTLSQFMVDAAISSLYSPGRKVAGVKMDLLRETQQGYYTRDELNDLRKEGRRE